MDGANLMARWYKLHTVEASATRRGWLKHVLEVWEGEKPPPSGIPAPNARLLALLFREELLRRLAKTDPASSDQAPKEAKGRQLGSRKKRVPKSKTPKL